MNKIPIKKSSIFNVLSKISKLKLGSENILLQNSINRFLEHDIKSKINLPPFNNSAVDGYSVLKKDITKNNFKLKIHNRIIAGDKKNTKLPNGKVSRIFTGARMPLNSKTVVMQENVITNNEEIVIKEMLKIEHILLHQYLYKLKLIILII